MDENPYASPTSPDSPSTFYTTEITKLTMTELWRIASPNVVGFLVVAIAKLSGSSMRNNAAFAKDGVRFLDVEELPLEVQSGTRSIQKECRSLGFEDRHGYTLRSLGDTAGYVLEIANPDGTISGSIIYARSGDTETVFLAYASELSDGTTVSTSSGRKYIDQHPSQKEKHFVGASPSTLLQRHKEHLEENGFAYPLRRDDEELRESALKRERLGFEYNIERGVYVPLTALELAKLT